MTSTESGKRALRRDARRRRSELGETAADASERAIRHLLGLPEVEAARTVALYAALPGEVDPSRAAAELHRRGTTVLLPRVAGEGLVLVSVSEHSALSPGFGGVAEPQGPAYPLGELEVVVVPGLAFSRAGDRLGQGGGHYDRLLARLPVATTRIALAFSVQLVDDVPTGPLDEPVDVIVTEEGVIRTGARDRTVRSDT